MGFAYVAQGTSRVPATWRKTRPSPTKRIAFDLPPDAEIRLATARGHGIARGVAAPSSATTKSSSRSSSSRRSVHRAEARERACPGELSRLAGIIASSKKGVLGVLESRGFRRESTSFIGAFVREAAPRPAAQ